MLRFLWLPAAACVAFAAGPVFELTGQFAPPGRAVVSLFGVSSPFTASTLSDDDGHFSFKKLEAAPYTLSIFLPSRGEARQTIEVGPGTADAHNRVVLKLDLKDDDFVVADVLRRRHSVPAKQLSVTDKAIREYDQAQKDLSQHAVDAAVKHLERAVALAPQFAMAWNNLGTIAYQTRKFERAEECFRHALEDQSDAFEPLVNLGGVLLTLNKFDEAMGYNLRAMLMRPNDALANSQLGMNYFALGYLDLAQKYVEKACQIDPSHFSHPQLILAEIHLRRGERRQAADVLEDFLKHHPDWPKAALMRERIAELRK